MTRDPTKSTAKQLYSTSLVNSLSHSPTISYLLSLKSPPTPLCSCFEILHPLAHHMYLLTWFHAHFSDFSLLLQIKLLASYLRPILPLSIQEHYYPLPCKHQGDIYHQYFLTLLEYSYQYISWCNIVYRINKFPSWLHSSYCPIFLLLLITKLFQRVV